MMNLRYVRTTVLLSVFMLAGDCGEVQGGYPIVGFDVGWTVKCREVTSEGRQANKSSKVIEAVFRFSPEVKAGDESDLRRIRYEIRSPDGKANVKAFAPGSEVGTDVLDGVIEIETSSEQGEISFHYVLGPQSAKGGATTNKVTSRLKHKLMVPKTLLLASGTIQRSSGVYYDLRPSKQDTLQRPRDFAILFEVPKTWNGDYVIIECRAEGFDRGMFSTEQGVCGLAMYSVGLHIDGDEHAEKLALELAAEQTILLEVLSRNRQKILEQARTTQANWAWLDSFLRWVRFLDIPGLAAQGASENFVGSALREMVYGGGKAPRNVNGLVRYSYYLELGTDKIPAEVRESSIKITEKQEALRRLNGK
jgi:hypothetical protein